MEEKNNFERLMEEYEKNMEENNRNSIHSGIWGTLGIFKFIGTMIELYIPKMFSFLIELSGGEQNTKPGD